MSPHLSRLGRDDHLVGKRGEMYRAICENPGINFEALREKVGMTGGGGPQYHLYVLEKLRYVQSFKVGNYRRYFAAGDQDYRRNKIRAMLTSPIYLKTALAVQRNPGAYARQIEAELPEVCRQTANYRLQKLRDAGAVDSRYEKGHAYYWLTMDCGYVLDHFSSGGDRGAPPNPRPPPV